MAKVTNSNFISFIKTYGPWANNEQMFEEHVRQNAESKHMVPFEYKSPNKNCLEIIKGVIERQTSQVLLICGSAGDGKTHLLGQIFEDPELLNLGTEQFKHLLATKNSVNFIKDVKGFDLTVVGDFSQIKEDDPEEQQLMSNILQVFVSKCLEKSNEAQNAEPNVAARPNLVVIAGNNGKILEKLNALQEKLKQFISDHSELAEHEHCAFMQLNLTLAQYKNLSEDVLKLVIDHLKALFIEKQSMTTQGITLIDMSNRIDREVLHEIFDVFLKHPKWSKCQECSCLELCPIYRNREILSYPWLQERFFNVLHLLKADGFNLTLRNVQYMLVNALLGRGFEANDKENDLTCLKIKNNVEANNGICTFQSNVYENLLGLNFKPAVRSSRSIFKALDSLNLAKHTTRQIDEFLLEHDVAPSDKIFSDFTLRFDPLNEHQKLLEAFNKLNNSIFDSKKVTKEQQAALQNNFTSKLQSMRRILFFNLGAPLNCDPHEIVQELWTHGTSSQPENKVSDASTLNQSLSTKEGYDNPENLLFDPYLLTCYPHAMDYFEVESLAKQGNVLGNGASDVSKKLVLALNRLFTSLYTSEDTKGMYVPANHINNLSILYDENIFKVKAYIGNNVERSIYLEQPPEYNVPVLKFIDVDLRDDKANRGEARLLLTPYMFECLMQLADGLSSVCLPQQAIHEAIMFKKKIFSILEQNLINQLKSSNGSALLDSIRRLEVNAKGEITTNN